MWVCVCEHVCVCMCVPVEKGLSFLLGPSSAEQRWAVKKQEPEAGSREGAGGCQRHRGASRVLSQRHLGPWGGPK